MAAVHADHRQLPAIRSPDHRLQRLELVGVQIIVPLPWIIQAPRLFAGKIDFGDVSQIGDGIRQHSATRCRSSATTTTRSRRSARRSSGCTGWSTPTNRAARCRPCWSSRAKTVGVELAGIEVRTPAGDQLIDALDVRLEPRRLAGDHRAVGQRQDHAAAQPGRTVAVRLGHAVPPGRRERDDVLVAVAVRAAGRSARGGVLPESAGRHRRRRRCATC